jgi:hypothetical protein
MDVDPQTLLPKYRHLYEDKDFAELGSGSTTNRLYWIAAAKTAVAASALYRACAVNVTEKLPVHMNII